jgi:hypothetical protein
VSPTAAARLCGLGGVEWEASAFPPGSRRAGETGKSIREPGAGRADEGIRTPDPFLTMEVLYRLSYVGAPLDASARSR